MAMSLLTLLGGLEVYTSWFEQKTNLPMLNVLDDVAPELSPKTRENTTKHLACKKTFSEKELWIALQPTLNIVRTLSPEIAKWVEQQYREGRFLFDPSNAVGPVAGLQASPVLRLLTGHSGELTLFRMFLALNDGEKAAALIHEFRHEKQFAQVGTMSKRILALLYSGQKFSDEAYINVLEEEAFAYEKEALIALGMENAIGDSEWVRYKNGKYNVLDARGKDFVALEKQLRTEGKASGFEHAPDARVCPSLTD